jgi:hypothetical protein
VAIGSSTPATSLASTPIIKPTCGSWLSSAFKNSSSVGYRLALSAKSLQDDGNDMLSGKIQILPDAHR